MSLPPGIEQAVRDRMLLLWVCQRHDLIDGVEPHDLDLPASEVALRYRGQVSSSDVSIASLYWEAAWLEGAASPVLQALRESTAAQPTRSRRELVTLSSATDALAIVSAQEFLPVAALAGVLDDNAPDDSRYGALRRKQRERVAFDLAGRLSAFPSRTMVVVGADSVGDLDYLWETLADVRLLNLKVIVVLPEDAPEPSPLGNPAVKLTVWRGGLDEFVEALRAAGAPSAGELPRWAVRLPGSAIELGATETHQILERFALITERDIRPPDRFAWADLIDFLDGDLATWRGFAAGIPARRDYRSTDGVLLADLLVQTAADLAADDSHGLTRTIEIPAESGSGATTALRQAAFDAASAGFPTLVLKPGQVDVDIEDLRAFTLMLTEKAAEQGIAALPPIVVALDAEHYGIASRTMISQVMAGHGRKAVIIQVNPNPDEPATTGRSRQVLPTLVATASGQDVENCEQAFRLARDRWNLEIDVPTIEDWRRYEATMTWRTPGPTSATTSLFWVALRYFLTVGMDLADAEAARESLGRWVARRAEGIRDRRMAQVVKYIAILSAQRITTPLWTVLRTVTGSSYSSDLNETLDQLDGIVDWLDFSPELEDQTLRFSHPALAEAYLRPLGITSHREEIDALRPLIDRLAQQPGDMWIAESIVTASFPQKSERYGADWEWLFGVIEAIPSLVRDQSRVILHHWARALYISADLRSAADLSRAGRESRFLTSIEKLERALELPRRRTRDESQTNLLNTLGTAYARYANFLREDPARETAEEASAWRAASKAFQSSLTSSGGYNTDPLLAFSERLVEHAVVVKDSNPALALDDISQAFGLLDSAQDLVDELDSPEPGLGENVANLRRRALTVINEELGQQFVSGLKGGPSAELGYLLEARAATDMIGGSAGIERALAVLDEARTAGVRLSGRSLALEARLMHKHPNFRYDFVELAEIYRTLEALGYEMSMVEAFRDAVVSYQVEDFDRGREKFRRLRERARNAAANAPLRLRDFWRDQENPSAHRVATIRVDRIFTEWRADGYIHEFRHTVPLRPRHFPDLPKVNQVVTCAVQFEVNGPLAVPPRFLERREARR